MNPDEVFDAWKRSRAETDVPADFAERVRDAIRRQPPPRAPRRLFAALRVAVGVAAVAACLFRIAATLGLFLEL
jgi:hypothetical protein